MEKKIVRSPRLSKEAQQQRHDAEIIFKQGSNLDSYEDAEQYILFAFFPDLTYSRAGISLGLKKLKEYFANIIKWDDKIFKKLPYGELKEGDFYYDPYDNKIHYWDKEDWDLDVSGYIKVKEIK